MANIFNPSYSGQFQSSQPYYQQQPFPPQPAQDQRTIHGFDWVIGMQGANAYNVPVGKTFVLFDASPGSNSFFLKSTDITGRPYPPVMFDYEQHKEAEPAPSPAPQKVDLSGYVPVAQFDALKQELEALKNRQMPSSLTVEDVRELFDQMMEQRFARVASPAETKSRKGDSAK